MRRSPKALLFATSLALLTLFALPVGASAGSSSDRDCSDFSSQVEAQAEYDSGLQDDSRLDANNDGTACEDEFGSGEEEQEDFDEVEFTDASDDEYPREGIASGGGSTASGGPNLLPLLVSAGAFGLLAAGSWGFTLRRRLGR